MTLQNIVRLVLAAVIVLAAMLGLAGVDTQGHIDFGEWSATHLHGTHFEIPSQLVCTGCSGGGGGPG